MVAAWSCIIDVISCAVQTLARQLAEVLLRGVCEKTYLDLQSSTDDPLTANHTTSPKTRPRKYSGNKYVRTNLYLSWTFCTDLFCIFMNPTFLPVCSFQKTGLKKPCCCCSLQNRWCVVALCTDSCICRIRTRRTKGHGERMAFPLTGNKRSGVESVSRAQRGSTAHLPQHDCCVRPSHDRSGQTDPVQHADRGESLPVSVRT